MFYLLCLVDRLRHGEEGAVAEDSQHHQVVEVLVHRHVDSDTTELNRIISVFAIPWTIQITRDHYCDTTELNRNIDQHCDTIELNRNSGSVL